MSIDPPVSVEIHLSDTAEVVRAPNLLATALDKELVIFDVTQDKYFSIDAIGSKIWQRLERPVNIGELCDELVLEYDATRAAIEEDVLTLLKDLVEAGLVEVRRA